MTRRLDQDEGFGGNDVLTFYSGSPNGPDPGYGEEEVVHDTTRYRRLASMTGWRRVLSNFHVCPFVWNGQTYRTLEHAFQASKIALVDKQQARMFTMESGTLIGKGDGASAR